MSTPPLAETMASPLLAGLRSGAWLDAQTFPPTAWFVSGLLPEGMALLVGGPKIGKSWLSLDIALAVASGGAAVGAIDVSCRPVLLLALEDSDRRLQDRARQLMVGGAIPAELDYMTRIEPGTVLDTVHAWMGTLHPEAQPLVIVDTLGKVMPRTLPGETDYQRDYRVAGGLKRVCDDRPGSALLVLHHDRKASADDFVHSVSGTNGIAGAADTIITLSRSRHETTGTLRITGRDVEEAQYQLTVDGGRWTLDGGSLSAARHAATVREAAANLGDRSTAILEWVGQQDGPVSAKEVGDALELPDARRYLARLVESGRLERTGRGRYSLPNPMSPLSLPSHSDDEEPPEGTNGTDGTVACEVCGGPNDPERDLLGADCLACYTRSHP